MIIKSTIKTYKDLIEFLKTDDHTELFKIKFGFNPTMSNIGVRLKSHMNWHYDVTIVEKVLSLKPGTFTVNYFEHDKIVWTEDGYKDVGEEFIVVIKLEE